MWGGLCRVAQWQPLVIYYGVSANSHLDYLVDQMYAYHAFMTSPNERNTNYYRYDTCS